MEWEMTIVRDKGMCSPLEQKKNIVAWQVLILLFGILMTMMMTVRLSKCIKASYIYPAIYPSIHRRTNNCAGSHQMTETLLPLIVGVRQLFVSIDERMYGRTDEWLNDKVYSKRLDQMTYINAKSSKSLFCCFHSICF